MLNAQQVNRNKIEKINSDFLNNMKDFDDKIRLK